MPCRLKAAASVPSAPPRTLTLDVTKLRRARKQPTRRGGQGIYSLGVQPEGQGEGPHLGGMVICTDSVARPDGQSVP